MVYVSEALVRMTPSSWNYSILTEDKQSAYNTRDILIYRHRICIKWCVFGHDSSVVWPTKYANERRIKPSQNQPTQSIYGHSSLHHENERSRRHGWRKSWDMESISGCHHARAYTNECWQIIMCVSVCEPVSVCSNVPVCIGRTLYEKGGAGRLPRF